VEQFEAIRRDSRDRGMSIGAIAERHGVHRRTVPQALADATPPPRRVPERLAPATGPYVDLVRQWLLEDQAAPRKQRHTARPIWQRLTEEEEVRIGESTVRNLRHPHRARNQVLPSERPPTAAAAETTRPPLNPVRFNPPPVTFDRRSCAPGAALRGGP
jgi:hypothetical protein